MLTFHKIICENFMNFFKIIKFHETVFYQYTYISQIKPQILSSNHESNNISIVTIVVDEHKGIFYALFLLR